jgi:hypothetical protein
MRKLAGFLMLGLLEIGSREAAAQGLNLSAPSDDRVLVTVGFGVEAGSSDMTDTLNFTLYEEAATATTTTTWSSGSFFEGSAAVRVYRNFTVGLGYHQETNTTGTDISGSAPHPVFFNRPRTFATTEDGLYRRENAVHLTFGWVVPIDEKLDVHVTAGPTFFRLRQDVVSEVTIAESGDFAAPVVGGEVTEQRKSVTGFNIGADVSYILWQNDDMRIGAGGFLRYTSAEADIPMLANEVSTNVGGMQFGFGARVRF